MAETTGALRQKSTLRTSSQVSFSAVFTSAFLPFCAQMKGSIKFPRRTVASITALGCIVGGVGEEYQGLGRTNVGGEIVL